MLESLGTRYPPPERLIYIDEVEVKKLRLISQRGFGDTSPKSRLDRRRKKEERTLKRKLYCQARYISTRQRI